MARTATLTISETESVVVVPLTPKLTKQASDSLKRENIRMGSADTSLGDLVAFNAKTLSAVVESWIENGEPLKPRALAEKITETVDNFPDLTAAIVDEARKLAKAIEAERYSALGKS